MALLVAPRIGNDVSYVMRIKDAIHFARVTLLAPRIGNDVSFVMQIKDAIDFAWQGQYLVKLEGGSSCCSAHWK